MCIRDRLEALKERLKGATRVLVVGCGTCTTVSKVGGEKEAKELASLLKLSLSGGKKPVKITTVVVKRQCEPEFLDELKKKVMESDVVVSLGCGAGVQLIAEKYPTATVIPGLNTKFIGAVDKDYVLREFCSGCGDCVLDLTFGLCPRTRCAKSLLNGPCGGVHDGMCEVADVPCVWVLIYKKAKRLRKLDVFLNVRMPRVN